MAIAYRTTPTEVKDVIDTELTAAQVDPFIATANTILNASSSVMTTGGVSTATMRKIETWLAAHLVAIRDPIADTEKIGDAQIKYVRGKLGMQLESTPYGQTVLLLDNSGILANLGKKRMLLERALVVEDA